MNITVESFEVPTAIDEAEDGDGVDAEGHIVRKQPGRPSDAAVPGHRRLVAAGAVALDVSVEGNAIVVHPADSDDDAEGHLFHIGRLVELRNDVVEVSDGDGVVRRYMRVGGSSHTPDAFGMKYRLGGGPRT